MAETNPMTLRELAEIVEADQRQALAAFALANWEPEYPGQQKPQLVTWFAGEPEDGLSGFYTKEDRDSFQRGSDGPFLRVVTGNTFRQMPVRALIAEEETDG